MSYILTQALYIKKKTGILPWLYNTTWGDWQKVNKLRCFSLCHEFKPELGEMHALDGSSAAAGHVQAEAGAALA